MARFLAARLRTHSRRNSGGVSRRWLSYKHMVEQKLPSLRSRLFVT